MPPRTNTTKRQTNPNPNPNPPSKTQESVPQTPQKRPAPAPPTPAPTPARNGPSTGTSTGIGLSVERPTKKQKQNQTPKVGGDSFSDSGVSLPTTQSSDGVSVYNGYGYGFDGSFAFSSGSDQVTSVDGNGNGNGNGDGNPEGPGYIHIPEQDVVLAEGGFRKRSRAAYEADDQDSFVSDDDDDDDDDDDAASITTDYAPRKQRQKQKQRNNGNNNNNNNNNNRKKHKPKPKDDEDEAFIGSSDDDDDDSEVEEFSIPKSEKDTFTFDYSIEKARRWSSAVSLPKGIWSDGERELFSRLAMRGFEPLIWRHWHLDFPTLPDSLFVGGDGEGDSEGKKEGEGEWEEGEPVIRGLKSEFHAIKSLSGLFNLSSRVRDCRILQVRPEVVIRRAIQKYIRWALYDANLHTRPQPIPVHAIYAQQQNETILQALNKLNRRLEKLAKRYVAAAESADESREMGNASSKHEGERQRHFPILYGFFLCGPIVAMLTVDSNPENPTGWKSGAGSKFVSQFDMSERGQDVWNSLAIAIMAMYVRSTMMEVQSEARAGLWRFPDDAPVDVDDDA